MTKQFGPNSAIVPFSVGRIYQTAYRNFKHDPTPLLFIVGSNAFHTIGINVHYLRVYQESMIQFIISLRQAQVIQTGLTMYQILKTRYTMIPKLAFRKYFTAMLRGKLVSEGISTIPEPNVINFIAEPWVRRLNNLIHPRVFSFGKVKFNSKDEESIRNQTIQTQYYYNKQKPFANRTQNNIIQYRKPGE